MAIAAVVSALLACDAGPPPGPPVPPPPEWDDRATGEADSLVAALAATRESEPSALTVRLAFGAGADLDLYVTGPDAEAVYYANSPGALGGALLEDRRCVHAAPRVETIRFPAPLRPGRYRVGVDYPHACDDARAPAVFAVEIDAPGQHVERRGIVRHGVFEPIVVEIDHAGASGARSRGDGEGER